MDDEKLRQVIEFLKNGSLPTDEKAGIKQEIVCVTRSHSISYGNRWHIMCDTPS